MATEIIKYVSYALTSGNNDGSSPANAFRNDTNTAMNTAISASYTKDLVVNDLILKYHITNSQNKIHGSQTVQSQNILTAFSAAFISSDINKIIIEMDTNYPDEIHKGYLDTAKFFFDIYHVSTDHLFWTQSTPQSVHFKNLQFRIRNWGGLQPWASSGTSHTYIFENCIFDNTDATRFSVLCSARGFNNSNSKVKFINCIFINWNLNYPDSHGCINFMASSPLLYMEFHNCQFNNVNQISYDNYYTTNYTNALFINCILDSVIKINRSNSNTYVTQNTGCKNNKSNNAVGISVGENNETNVSFTFENEANNYYKIKKSDTGAKDKGYNNSVDIPYDILGTEKPTTGTVDVGAFELGINKIKNKKLNYSFAMGI